jgi:hypothetical protein
MLCRRKKECYIRERKNAMSEEERVSCQKKKEYCIRGGKNVNFEGINNVRGRKNAMSEGRGMLC